MGCDYYAEEDGEIEVNVIVEHPTYRSEQSQTVKVPEGSKVYLDVVMDGGVRER